MTTYGTTNLQTSPYLPRQRNFPKEPESLPVVLDKMYIEIAQRVNDRTIGIFATNFAVVTGESWFFSGQPRKQQTLRQVYPFGAIATNGVLSIPHDIKNIVQFTRIYGTVITAFPDYRPVPYASTVANDNIAVRADTTFIQLGNGSAAPAIVSGFIVLEWLSDTDTNS